MGKKSKQKRKANEAKARNESIAQARLSKESTSKKEDNASSVVGSPSRFSREDASSKANPSDFLQKPQGRKHNERKSKEQNVIVESFSGKGHRLNEGTLQAPGSASQPAEAKNAAGVAALSRCENNKTEINWSLKALQARARKVLEDEEAAVKSVEDADETGQSNLKSPGQMATEAVLFTCPMIGPELLPKKKLNEKIREFLYAQLKGEDACQAASLIIHTINKNKEKIQLCVETLCLYIDNIVANPLLEKYRKIRVNNKAFQEKVYQIEGSTEFLSAAGFCLLQLPGPEGNEEDYYVYTGVDDKIDSLKKFREVLTTTEPVSIHLDRGLQVLLPAEALQRSELPDDFFCLTVEDIKREQMLKTQAIEQGMMLRTKAMRERDSLRERMIYRYSLVRIRFPDGIILQGTFKVNEKFIEVSRFVQENLEEPSRPFTLLFLGKRLTDLDNTLLNLNLVPKVTLSISWDEGLAENGKCYVKEEILSMVKSGRLCESINSLCVS